MQKVICLSTAEIVNITLPIPYNPNLTLKDLIAEYACFRSPHGLHFYTGYKRKKALLNLTHREIIPKHLLEIIEVPVYKIVYLPTGEEVIRPCNSHGNEMTIKQARRYLRSDKSYTVRHLPTNEIYFTTEPEFQDTHPFYNEGFCKQVGRVKIPKEGIRIVRVPK